MPKLRPYNMVLVMRMVNPPLQPQVRRLAARETVFNETEDAATQDAAYMEVLAAQMELRAEIHRARLALATRIEAVNPAEAQRIRESLAGGVA